MSRPPDRSRDKPRRPFRERQNDRGDRESPRPDGPRSSGERPSRPWRDKRVDSERRSGPDERPQGPRADEGRGPRRPWQKDRPGDRGPGRKEYGERQNRDRRDARTERTSDGPRPERHPPWKRRPEAEDENKGQSRPYSDRRERDHRSARSERPEDAPRPERRPPWNRRPESEVETHSEDREQRGDRRQRVRGPRPERASDAPRPDRRQHWKRHAEPEDEDRILIWGIHAVEAALRNPKREVKRLLLTDNAAHRLEEALRVRPVTPQEVSPRDLDNELGPDTVHQGALLETSPLEEPTIDEVLASSPSPLIVALDQVTDPHNAGAILRSAAAFGVAAIIMTRRHSPPSSGALAKSASGALELVPVLHVPNLAQALGELGDKHVLRLGLDGEATDALEDVVTADTAPSGPIALVLGAEERGLRRLSKDLCDRLVRLMTPGALASLNVSNAAAIAMHHIAIARRSK